MELICKAGSRYPKVGLSTTEKDIAKQNSAPRDGQVLEIRKDGWACGKYMRKHFVVIQVPEAFFSETERLNLCKIYCNDSQRIKVDSKRYKELRAGAKLVASDKVSFRSEWFVDFKKLLLDKLIDQRTYESIYNWSNSHRPIKLNIDFRLILRNEYTNSRITEQPNMAWSGSGETRTVGSMVGDDYNSWVTAVNDLTSLTGDATLIGAREETITESSNIVIDNPANGYKLTITSPVYTQGIDGSGHVIDLTNYSIFGGVLLGASCGSINISKLVIKSVIAGYVSYMSDTGTTLDIHNNVFLSDEPAIRCLKVSPAADYKSSSNIYNNILVGQDLGTISAAIELYQITAGSHAINNNTVIDYGLGISAPSTTAPLALYNNLVQGCTICFGSFPMGSFSHASNISDDATSPDTAFRSLDKTENFVSYVDGNCLLKSTDSELDSGIDLSATFTTDILGNTREIWMIGASEYFSAAGNHWSQLSPWANQYYWGKVKPWMN